MSIVLRVGFAFVIAMMQFGCASKPVPSDRVGECFVLATVQGVWSTKRTSGYMGDNMLTSPPFAPTAYGFSPEMIGLVPAGTKIEIYEFISGSNGSFGRFLRTQIKVLDGPHSGLVADIPACVPYHPQPRWTLNCSLDPDVLQFDSEIVKDCDT